MGDDLKETENKTLHVRKIGEGIAFGCLCLAAAWLEINGKPAAGLWVLVVFWAIIF